MVNFSHTELIEALSMNDTLLGSDQSSNVFANDGISGDYIMVYNFIRLIHIYSTIQLLMMSAHYFLINLLSSRCW